MKKIIVTITALALGVSALAKTSAEIAADYTAFVNSGVTQWNAGQQVYEANAAEVPVLYQAWKDTNSAKFNGNEAPNATMTDAQKKESYALRAIFARYLIANPTVLAAAPVRTACLAVPSRYIAAVSESNPTFYADLKAADFVLDGVKLPAYSRFNLAKSAADTDYVKSATVAEGMEAQTAYLEVVLPALLESTDVEAAKAKCKELENWFFKKGIFSSANLTKVQAVSKALTARLVDAKILGK